MGREAVRNRLEVEMTEKRASEYIRRKDLPALTGLSLSYFKRAAWLGEGPPFIKPGRAVLYPLDGVRAWLESYKFEGGKSNAK